MDLVLVLAIQVVYAMASLALISVGLAIIFGMMRVINLAHGEFLMLGGYAAIFATQHGVNIWIAMLIVAPIVVGAIGVIVERTLIRFLYGRMIDTMLATWGLSLFLVGLTTVFFGNTTVGISAPLGGMAIGNYNVSIYSLVVILITAVLLAGIFVVLRYTRLGLFARGTMQNANMAAALGLSPPKVYALTFGIGAALSGLAGGVIAPISGVFPSIGVAYVAKAFITVIGGGAAILTGTLTASGAFGAIQEVVTYFSTPVFGVVATLGAAIILIRLLPRALPVAFSGEACEREALEHRRPDRCRNHRYRRVDRLPEWVELSTLLDSTVYIIMAILALSLALVWGYGGILCFGQSAFFGLGAYTYALTMFNMGESTVPFIAAILVPAAFAALLGYFMFYGRISDVYLGVITLTVTLILFNSVNSTAGPEYAIGKARLGGFNGIPAIPSLNMPGNASAQLDLNDMFYLSMGLLLLTYFGLRWLLASRFGRVMIAIRENERRAEFLGYDARLHKLLVFSIGGGIAGMAGCLFANWGSFVSPTVFGLAQSAQIIIWVIVGGAAR